MGKKDQGISRDMNQQQFDLQQQMQQAAIGRENKQLDRFNTQLDALTSKNPWADTGYQQNQNLVEGSVAAAQNNAAKDALRSATARTGTNSAALGYNLKEMNRQKSRMLLDYQAGRKSDEYNKWIELQRWATAARMDPASLYGGQAGIAGSGINSAMSAQEGLASTPGTFGTIMSGVAGLGSAAINAYCPAEGAVMLLYDGSERLIEQLKKGDLLKSLNGAPNPLLDDPRPRVQERVQVTGDWNLEAKVGVMHTFMVKGGGYEFAGQAEDKRVLVRFGDETRVTSVEEIGPGVVYELPLGGDHTYRADNFWALM